MIKCFNIHFIDACNYSCTHCFVNKQKHELSFDEIKIVVDKIKDYYESYGVKGRINLAGGEPLLSKNINQIIDYIYSKGIEVSLITNASRLTNEFIDINKNKLSMIGISVDSLDEGTNIKIKRCDHNLVTLKKDNLIEISKYIKDSNIKLKINTCVSKLNLNEDFNEFLSIVKPDRFKALQMLCDDNDVINVGNRITDNEFNDFVFRHTKYISVCESAKELKCSYIIVDSEGNLSINNKHDSKYSLLSNNIFEVLDKLDFNNEYHDKRYKEGEKQDELFIF